jgi:hypothetical protein
MFSTVKRRRNCWRVIEHSSAATCYVVAVWLEYRLFKIAAHVRIGRISGRVTSDDFSALRTIHRFRLSGIHHICYRGGEEQTGLGGNFLRYDDP